MTDYYVDEGYEGDGYDVDPEDGYDYYADEDLDGGIDTLRPGEVEGRTSWMYLGLLLALFVLLVAFSWACNDRSSSPGEPQTEEQAEVTSGAAVRLSMVVDGDVITLSGTVPDDAARDQILVETQDLYGAENVIDEVVVDANTSLDDGVVSVTGSALFDDTRPQDLQQAIGAGLGLAAGDFAVDRGEAVVDPVSLQAELNSGALRLVGTVPDDASVADLVAAGEAVWGAGNVDASALSIADSSWTDSTITVTGSSAPGDDRVGAFVTEIQNRFGASVTVDASEVTIDQSEAVLSTLEENIKTDLLADPILFAPLSADIDPASDAVITRIAEILQQIPDVDVEVVGHTDSAGNDQDNLVLSQDRAASVIARLVEIGIDQARLNARGEGEAIPIGDNDTAEGREQNRRIEFVLVG